MNNLKNYTTQQLKDELLNRCQFNRPGCTETAELWGIEKLASGEIRQNHICLSCAEWVEASLATQRKVHLTQHKSRVIKNHAQN